MSAVQIARMKKTIDIDYQDNIENNDHNK